VAPPGTPVLWDATSCRNAAPLTLSLSLSLSLSWQDYMATLLTTPATMEADSGLGEPTPSAWPGPAVKADSEDESEAELTPPPTAPSSNPRPGSARASRAWGMSGNYDELLGGLYSQTNVEAHNQLVGGAEGPSQPDSEPPQPRCVIKICPRNVRLNSRRNGKDLLRNCTSRRLASCVLSTVVAGWEAAETIRGGEWRRCRRRSVELARGMESKSGDGAKEGFHRAVAGNMYDLRPATSQGGDGRDSLSPAVDSPKDWTQVKEVRLACLWGASDTRARLPATEAGVG
jgi:hypothetical protein